MYFPEDMTFQYFFFDTYPGYFLEVLPVALLAGAVYIFMQRRREPGVFWGRRVLASLFVCYIAGLVALTLLIMPLGNMYYRLFYHSDSGMNIRWFTFEYYLVPNTFFRMSGENIGNFLLYLPFGLLYPLFRREANWKRTVRAGVGTSLAIELLQPIFGRSFDVNDIILNGLGVILSTAVFYNGKRLLFGKKGKRGCKKTLISQICLL